MAKPRMPFEPFQIKSMKLKKTVPTHDALVISRGRERDNALSGKLEGRRSEVHEIGDCSCVGDTHKAIFSANQVARAI